MQFLFAGCLSICCFWFLTGQPDKPSKERGAEVYKQYCLTCHQADGNGVPLMNPSLVRTTFVTGNKSRLIMWVLKGTGPKKAPIEGKTYPNNMAPLGILSDQQISDVLTYIRTAFGNQSPAITAAEVKKVRASAN